MMLATSFRHSAAIPPHSAVDARRNRSRKGGSFRHSAVTLGAAE